MSTPPRSASPAAPPTASAPATSGSTAPTSNPPSSAPEPGALVTITDSREIPLGTALYSSASTIAARLVSRTPALTRAQYLADLRTRIDAALQLRRELAPTSATNNAHRLIFSEADNLPGIIADRYNDLVLLQLLTQGTAQDDVRAVLVAALAHAFAKEKCALTLWERPDPRIRELEQLPAPAPGPLFTTHTDSIAPDGLSFRTETQRDADQAAPTTTLFSLNGLSFHYDAASGQKTGAFLDQRLNYAAATRAVKPPAARSGLRHLHLPGRLRPPSRPGLLARHRSRRQPLRPRSRRPQPRPQPRPRRPLRSRLDRSRRLRLPPPPRRHRPQDPPPPSNLFDAIVLDPPAFAKSKRAAEGALRGYKELNLRALRLLTPGGTLITNSCSHHVSLQEFTEILASAAADANRRVQLLETHAAAPDHPEVINPPRNPLPKMPHLPRRLRLAHIPAYHEYPPSGAADPHPFPYAFIESVTVSRVMYFTLLYPSCRGTRMRSGPPNLTGRSPSFMPHVSSVCGCSASPISMLSHHSGSIEKYATYRACGSTPTAFSTSTSGVPIHSAMYDHPSSHATSVIWLRVPMSFTSASEYDPGRATNPSTASRQSANPFACKLLNASLGGATAFANGAFEIMPRGNSLANACRVSSRCVAYVSVSPGP